MHETKQKKKESMRSLTGNKGNYDLRKLIVVSKNLLISMNDLVECDKRVRENLLL